MSEEVKHDEAAGGEKKSKTLMIVIIAVLVLIIIGGGVAAMMLMGGDEHADAAAGGHGAPQETHASDGGHGEAAPKEKKHSSSDSDSRKLSEIGDLYPLDTFTVNLKSDSGRRYLKATVSLELGNHELSIELDKKVSVVRDRIIKILSSKSVEEISSDKGKEQVGEQIVEVLDAMMVDGSIKGLYFTEFVVQ